MNDAEFAAAVAALVPGAVVWDPEAFGGNFGIGVQMEDRSVAVRVKDGVSPEQVADMLEQDMAA